MTQKQILIKYLDYLKDWCPVYKLRSVNTPFGFLGHQADRRVRELAQAGLIERKVEGRYAYVRGIPKITYKVVQINKETVKYETLPNDFRSNMDRI